MRINVYPDELTDRTELVVKSPDNHDASFYGVRLHLAPGDTSAITFWVPWSPTGGYDFTALRVALDGLYHQIDQAERRESSR